VKLTKEVKVQSCEIKLWKTNNDQNCNNGDNDNNKSYQKQPSNKISHDFNQVKPIIIVVSQQKS